MPPNKSKAATLPGALGFDSLLLVALITLAGSTFVFASMIIMNRDTPEPPRKDMSQIVSFTVAPPPTTPRPREQRQEELPRRAVKSTRALVAPAPGGGANLSGITIAVPNFTAEGIGDISASLLGDLDDVALTEDAVDEKPSPRSAPVPIYPDRAKQRSIEGRVLASALIGADGRVKTVAILESSPPGVFDAAVEAVLKNWVFEPARYKGQAVQTWVNIPFPFRLN